MSPPGQQRESVRRPKRRSCWQLLLRWIKRNLLKWNLLTQYLLYFAGISLYLLLGGLAFYLIEHPYEETVLEHAREVRINFTIDLADQFGLDYNETLPLVERIEILCNDGIFIDALDTIPRQWEYGPSVFFAMTVITTIG